MSEDGFPDPFDEASIDLFVETLTGTSFEMRVYPTDTVLDIKNKIFRVEGIPVHHQNLLFQMKELQDFVKLADAGVVQGSTLKLVLSMRGGPISTRRLNTCDHHLIWRDLKDLIEHTRDEIGEKHGSKVSVLVFKEGEVINVIRVIENEDGSYSPYTDKAISPPCTGSGPGHTSSSGARPQRDRSNVQLFKKISEDMEMATKIHMLKSKMRRARQQRASKVGSKEGENSEGEDEGFASPAARGFSDLGLPTAGGFSAFKILDDHLDAEIALKEKHRSKNLFTPTPTPASTSSEKYLRLFDCPDPLPGRFSSDTSRHRNHHRLSSPFENDEEPLLDASPPPEPASIDIPCAETSLSLSARNRVHLTRLVLPDGHTSDRGGGSTSSRTSPDALDIDDGGENVWDMGGGYKVGLLQRRTSLESDFGGCESAGAGASASGVDCGGGASGGGGGEAGFDRQNGDYEVFGGSSATTRNYHHYHVPQFVTTQPSAIPPQYAPKDERICDLYLGSPVPESKIRRSPLYGRRSKNVDTYNIFKPSDDHLPPPTNHFDANTNSVSAEKTSNSSSTTATAAAAAAATTLLQNDFSVDLDYDDFDIGHCEDMFGYYNAGWDKLLGASRSWSDPDEAAIANEIKRLSIDIKLDSEEKRKPIARIEDLPTVVSKKRMRCGQCNKRLNITNIYNCRCGRIFCSQHRYSETHDCKYDYKTEGRKLLEQQNPLVTASKLTKF